MTFLIRMNPGLAMKTSLSDGLWSWLAAQKNRLSVVNTNVQLIQRWVRPEYPGNLSLMPNLVLCETVFFMVETAVKRNVPAAASSSLRTSEI